MNSSTFDSRIKKPILKIGLFLILLFISDRLLYFLISGMEGRFLADHHFKRDFIDYTEHQHFSTLILGTSRTLEAIHPLYFKTMLNKNAYREAQFGKGPRYNYMFYQFYRQHCGAPRVMIYGLDYFMFSLESRIRWLYRFEFKEQKDYLGHFSMLLEYKRNSDDLIEAMLDKLKQLLGEIKNPESLLDFIENQNYLGINFNKSRINPRKPDRFTRFRYVKFPGKEGEYFFKLLKECEKDGVKVVLVFIPDYHGTNVSNRQRHRFHKDINGIAQSFDNIHVYDYNRVTKFPLRDRTYFINGGYGLTNSHLSKKGAALFNRLLIRDIKQLYAGNSTKGTDQIK